jgi:hypothetical protein
MRQRPKEEIKVPHRHAWLWEPLEEEPGFELRPMFGFKAVYLDEKIIGCFCAKDAPWNGVLLATSREHHPSLIAEFPQLAPHPILSKWLYLPDSLDRFDAIAERLIRLARKRDLRIGVVPAPKKKKAAKKTVRSKARVRGASAGSPPR